MILLDTDHLSLLQARDAPIALLGTNGQAHWGVGPQYASDAAGAA
jgi:hypothetical protein